MAAIPGRLMSAGSMDGTKNLERTIVRNASTNLVRLAGSGVIALVLPAVLVRTLPPDTYGAWALLLQLTLYVAYLDFGIQTAVAKFVAGADELNDTQQRDGIVSTSFAMLVFAALIGLVLIATLAWQLSNIFPQMPRALVGSAEIALLLIGSSLALGLPFFAIQAFFTGLRRNEIPASIVIANKFIMALLVIIAALKHLGLAVMGAGAAVANLLSYAGSAFVWRLCSGGAKIRLSLASRFFARQIGAYSGAVLVWTVAMLMISGLDLSIVGMFDYKSVAYYAVAATLTNLLVQAQGASFAALLPASSVLAARGDTQRLGELLVSSTRYGMLIMLAVVLPLILGGKFALRIWAGADYAQHSTAILQVLLIANLVRLCALPYSTLLLGTGQQNKVILSPLVEGTTNLAASVIGAYLLGAIGVAIGTLIGSLVSIGFHIFYNMPRTVMIAIDRARIVKEGLLRPLTCGLPFIGLVLIHSATQLTPEAQTSLFVIASFGAALLLWKYGLVDFERQKVVHAFRLHRAKP